MENFTIKGDSGNLLSISYDEVCGFPKTESPMGGYDFKAGIHLKSSGFHLSSSFYDTTNEVYQFYEMLKNANSNLKGQALYQSFEGNLKFKVIYDDLGHTNIKGTFTEYLPEQNELKFEFRSDQSFISAVLEELETLIEKYGK